MVLISPHSFLVKFLSLSNEEQHHRNDVCRGIFSLAQCHGRNTIIHTERLKLDVLYVDYCTLWTDFKVTCVTVMKVLKRDDNVTSRKKTTMEALNGHN